VSGAYADPMLDFGKANQGVGAGVAGTDAGLAVVVLYKIG
jgi:hypothetical protein